MRVGWALERWTIDQVYGPDLMLKIAEATQDGRFTHFFRGGWPRVEELLQKDCRKDSRVL